MTAGLSREAIPAPTRPDQLSDRNRAGDRFRAISPARATKVREGLTLQDESIILIL